MKKTSILFCFVLLASILLLAACGSTSSAPASIPVPSSVASMASSMASMPEVPIASEKVFTVEELAKFDGKDGTPAYIAVAGVVYDVTNAPDWKNGEHKSGITAGKDLTEEIKEAPHGDSVLADLPIVGKMAA